MNRNALHTLAIFLLSIIAGALLAAGVATLAPESRGEQIAKEEKREQPLDPAVEYMLRLEADDYATYTHPQYGFSFSYPKEFVLLTDRSGDEDVIDLHHPVLPLGIRISVHPFDPDGELFAELASLSDEYDLEAPDGANSNAVGWIDEDVPAVGEHRGVYWFMAHDHLFEIQMLAPDLAWLDAWMRGFAHNNFKLIPPSLES